MESSRGCSLLVEGCERMKCAHFTCHQCVATDDVQRLTQERDEARSLLREAHRELATIEAITVSPSGADGLLDLVRRIGAAVGEEP